MTAISSDAGSAAARVDVIADIKDSLGLVLSRASDLPNQSVGPRDVRGSWCFLKGPSWSIRLITPLLDIA